MKYKLAAFDLDGTLLDNNMHLQRETKLSLLQLEKRGIIPAVISARPLNSIQQVVKGCCFPYISGLNGALIYSTVEEKMLSSSPINSENIDFIRSYLLKNSIPALFFTAGSVYSTCYPEEQFDLIYVRSLSPRAIRELGGSPEVLSIQIMTGNGKTCRKVQADFAKKTLPDLELEDCGFNFLQINKKGIDKAFALKYIIAFLDIPAEQTIAVGDSDSDISMIKAAGTGIGMKNAAASLLAASDDITEKDNNNNGALHLLLKKYVN